MKVKLELNGEARYLTEQELDMPLVDVLGYRAMYFRCVVLANAARRIVDFEDRYYGPCEQCDRIEELSFEKFGDDLEIFLCRDCLEHVYGRMQQRMEDDAARELRET